MEKLADQVSAFARVEAGLGGVLEELQRLEPIFHTAEFGRTAADFERRMAAEYWEVGASGRRYSREDILHHLAKQMPVDAASAGWTCGGFGLREIGGDTYLLTYTLRQGGRVTRRATIWERSGGAWRIVFHQGTVVSADEDGWAPE